MKILIFLLLFILSLPIVFSLCSDNILFYSPINSTSCEDNLVLKLIDINEECADEGNCWDNYKNATIVIDKNSYTYDRLTKNLEKWEFDSGSWSIKCNYSKNYTFKTILKNDTSSCTETLILDLTEPEKEQIELTTPIASKSSYTPEDKKGSTIIIPIIIIVVFGSFIGYLLIKKD